MLRLRGIQKANIEAGTRVLVRIDANVQVVHGTVDEDARARLEAVVPTIKELLKKRAVITLMSHRGEPQRKERALSLRPVCEVLSKVIGHEVQFLAHAPGSQAYNRSITRSASGTIKLLENLRFFPGEKTNDPMFAKQLAHGQDVYINDAFASCHRAHASILGITNELPSYAGFLLVKEVGALEKILWPKKPFIIVIGGAKISSKIETLNALLPKAAHVLVGGGLANSFLAAKGYELGRSRPETKEVAMAKHILESSTGKIVVPEDVVTEEVKVVKKDRIPKTAMVLDVGPESLALFEKTLAGAATVVWNGPLGLLEKTPFDRGTMALVKILKRVAEEGAYVVVGGGETVMALRRAGATKAFSHVSTGGGAMLDFLAEGSLAGIEPLLIH